MKTNQEMVRYIDKFSVVQRTSDGYFDGSELLRQWNEVEGNPRRRMSEFIDSPKVKEFLKALAEDESHKSKIDIVENQLLMKIKGRNTKEGKTPEPIIVTYGDLCIIQRVLFDAQKSLLGLLQGKEDAIKKANGTFDELHKLFEYVDKVLMDGNISKETIRRLDSTIKIPD